MHSLRQLWSILAAVLLLFWGSATMAQSSQPLNASPSNAKSSPPGSSTVMNSLICDSAGKVCVAVSRHRIVKSQAPVPAPSAAVRPASSRVPTASASPALNATAQSQSAPQTTVKPSRLLICDASGTICDLATASVASSSLTRNPGQPSPKIDARKLGLEARGSHDHASQINIDGIDGYGDAASWTREDPFDWAVHVYKSQHRLEVFFKGRLYKTYHAVFGRSLAPGAKLWEGDRRTPEGDYLITGKHRSARFGWFLHLNYPNEQDEERFEQSRAAHLIPASAREGGQIGIHGTDSPYLNVSDVDWTTGCISVDNADIGELARLLPVGTLVIIKP
jgi:hypothetical protein